MIPIGYQCAESTPRSIFSHTLLRTALAYLICKLLQYVLDGDRFKYVPLLIEHLCQTTIGRIKIKQNGGTLGATTLHMHIAFWHMRVTANLSGDRGDFNTVLKGHDLERALQYGGSHLA